MTKRKSEQKEIFENKILVKDAIITFEEHSTGAVRSTDADDVDYWLISPIALFELAKIAGEMAQEHQKTRPLEHLSLSISFQFNYLSGNRDKPWLALALWHNLAAIDKFTPKPESQMNIDLTVPILLNHRTEYFEYIPPLGLKAIAQAYNEGKKKYSAYNCEKGFPISNLLNHVLKHQCDFLAGKCEEDDLGHAGWGLLMAIHSEKLWPELNKNLRSKGCIPPQNEPDKKR